MNMKIMKHTIRKRLLITLTAMACQLSVSIAQNKVVTGTVYDEQGEPVIGATVQVKGTKIGTVTDFDGNYKLEVPEKAKVTISYIGYVAVETTGGTVKLQEDRTSLEEVVVVGYGTQKMKNVTGAVEAIAADELKDLSVGSLGDALAGQFNGVSVSRGAGAYRPGQSPTLQIRNASANTQNTPGATNGGDPNASPLYVIDDFISTEEAFNNLDISVVAGEDEEGQGRSSAYIVQRTVGLDGCHLHTEDAVGLRLRAGMECRNGCRHRHKGLCGQRPRAVPEE